MTNISGSAIRALGAAMKRSGEAEKIAEILNSVDALNTTEAAFLDGVTAGTAAASKAVVLDAGKNVATITKVTATEAVATNVNATTANLTECVATNVNATTIAAATTLNTNGLDVTANTVGFFQSTPNAQIVVNAAANNDVDELLAQLNATIAALTTFGLFS